MDLQPGSMTLPEFDGLSMVSGRTTNKNTVAQKCRFFDFTDLEQHCSSDVLWAESQVIFLR